MSKVKKHFGIDISKDVIDISNKKEGHHQLKNSSGGFSKFKKRLDDNSYCIMEATGLLS